MFLFIHNSFIIENKERESNHMEISYNRLFKLLIDKGMKKTEFAKIAGLTPGTLAKLSKNQTVSMDSLIKMCKTLNCTFDDIVEIVGEE
ncbi:helix-turn-helix domain-containing protein [Holdemanella biformis]